MFFADLPQLAPTLFKLDFLGLEITNSMVFAWIIALGIFVVCRIATRRMQEVPSGAQNFVEMLVESLQNFLNTLLEPKVTRWALPFIATFFIFILVSNLMGLMPGVGSILWKSPIEEQRQKEAHRVHAHIPPDTLTPSDNETPAEMAEDKKQAAWYHSFPLFADGHNIAYTALLRPPTADANMTVAMALVFFFANFWWALRYNGPVGLLKHIFGVKGGLKGILFFLLIPVFLFVGVLETISILIRPVALSMRLYGNIYGGESVLTLMLGMLPFGVAAIPFYFLELLVGIIQTLVFTILCIAFTATLCSHGDDHHEHGHGKADGAH